MSSGWGTLLATLSAQCAFHQNTAGEVQQAHASLSQELNQVKAEHTTARGQLEAALEHAQRRHLQP
jgi:hypothetical protein